jgi:hypothetical protein
MYTSLVWHHPSGESLKDHIIGFMHYAAAVGTTRDERTCSYSTASAEACKINAASACAMMHGDDASGQPGKAGHLFLP